VDVGVEDLNDLAHMEVAEEVRQWEDRIVSQHMVALQEDARLLTKESELLSQVQQGASYDIDWYVSEVDKVVRRKMEVYMSFMEDLEAFKAQLKREESLSRSCQRGRGKEGAAPAGGSGGTSAAAAGSAASAQHGAEVATAVPLGSGSTGSGAGTQSHLLHSSLHGVSNSSPRPHAREPILEGTPQRTPRTPRLAAAAPGHYGLPPMESR